MTGIELIAAERERQISGEGYTAERDKHYTYNQLARAGRSVFFIPGSPPQ